MRLRGLTALCVAAALLGCTPSAPEASSARTPIASAVPTPRSPEDVRYVSVHGDDRGPGTENHPWRTLSESLPKLYAGQVLYVHGGVYREVLDRFNLHDGREDRPITVTNVGGETPIVKGTVSLHRPDHWLFNGLDVTWDRALRDPPRFMVRIVGGVGWTWSNSVFRGSRGAANLFVAGFGESEPSSWALREDCFHGLRAAPAADPANNLMLGDMVHPGHGKISRNVFMNDDGQENVAVGSAHGAPRNVDMSFNTIYGGRLAILLRGGPRDVRIKRNLVGGASSDVLVRFDLKPAPGTELSQNYAILARPGQSGARRLMRPSAEEILGGPGNVESTFRPYFEHPGSCEGYRTQVPALSPYGRYGL